MDVNQKLTIKVVTDLEECRQLWEKLSPKETIYDDWNFRCVFHKYYKHELYFIVAYADTTCVGLLSLQKNKDTGVYEAWCGSYMEDNRAMILPGHENVIPVLYEHVPKPVKIEYIRGEDQFTTQLSILDYKYIIPTDKYSSFEDHLTVSFDSPTRGKFRRKIRHIENEKISIHLNRTKDMEFLFKYNLERFKDHSSFADRPYHKEIFYNLLEEIKDHYLISFEINNEVVAVSFAILYNDVYEYFNLGVKTNTHKDLPTFVHYTNFNMALQQKAKVFDAFVGSYGWKELWHMDKIPQYVYKKTA